MQQVQRALSAIVRFSSGCKCTQFTRRAIFFFSTPEIHRQGAFNLHSPSVGFSQAIKHKVKKGYSFCVLVITYGAIEAEELTEQLEKKKEKQQGNKPKLGCKTHVDLISN